MNSEKLDNLFGAIRNEATETSVQEVGKWVAVSAASVGLFGLLAQFKLPLFLTKKFIIMTSIISTLGITTALLLASPSPTGNSEKNEKTNEFAKTSLIADEETSSRKTEPGVLIKNDTKENPILSIQSPIDKITSMPIEELETADHLQGFQVSPIDQKTICSDGIERSLGTFSQIKVGGVLQVFISQGETESVILKTTDEIASQIETEIDRDVLEITSKKNSKKAGGVEIHVTVTDLKGIIASGASQIRTSDLLNAPDFKIKAEGAASIIMEIRSDALKIKTNGAANVKLSGSATSVNIQSGGASNVSAFDLKSTHIEIKASGAANIKCNASENLIISANDAANITYEGSPSNLDTKTSISANVEQRR